MSAIGTKRTFKLYSGLSAIGPKRTKADLAQDGLSVMTQSRT